MVINDEMESSELKALAKSKEKENKKFFSKLKQRKPADLDTVVSNLHNKVFEKTDCLQCANCCKTTSPIFYMKDIERISKYLRMKSSEFIQQYLHIDEDRDYVLYTAPCPFLGENNYCTIYESRPAACRAHPHTNAREFHRLFNITIKNTMICPAAYEVVEQLKMIYK